MKIKKITSGALQFTVFIAVLIALLLSGLILYAYTFGYFKEQSKATIENIQLSNSGINYLLSQPEVSTDTLLLDLIKKENQTIQVYLSTWGVFQKAFVKTTHRKKIFTKTGIIGSLIDSEKSPTLFLQETYNPLTLVGNTKIIGNAYLPTQGVKPGYIAGQSYYGAQLIYGKIEKSGASLPKINKDLLEQLFAYQNTNEYVNQDNFTDIVLSKNIVNSFKLKTRKVNSESAIVLENVKISGNIIIKSNKLIKVKKSAVLKDIILIAPIIEIENGVFGNFQAIASKKIMVGKNCQLNYPSALVLCQENKPQATLSEDRFDNQIFIDSKTQIKGCVCYFQKNSIENFKTQIVLEENAKIKGEVYCEGSFELKGSVSGSVFTKQFVANQTGSVFVNHIYNGEIENKNIPSFFGGIIFDKQQKIIVKWLY